MLRRLRAEARLTQEELAEAAGVSPRSVSGLARALALYRDIGDQPGQADVLNELGFCAF